MKFAQLIRLAGEEPVFETGLMLAGDANPVDVQRQLSRWTTAGKLIQLRRGLYALAPPYRKIRPHPFVVANRLVRGSYVSLQSALVHYGLIPEYVPLTTSVTTLRPCRYDTPLGEFDYQRVQTRVFFGYRRTALGGGEHAFVATPEKALLDLVYLTPGGDEAGYLLGLRLQNLDRMDLSQMRELAERFGKPKLARAAEAVATLAMAEAKEYETL